MLPRLMHKSACSLCLFILARSFLCVDALSPPATFPDKKLMRRQAKSRDHIVLDVDEEGTTTQSKVADGEYGSTESLAEEKRDVDSDKFASARPQEQLTSDGSKLGESKFQAVGKDGVTAQETQNHTIDLESVCSHPSATPASKWKGLSAMANILNSLNAPWNLHLGALLGLARSCSIFDHDLDFAVEHQWMRDNHDKVEEAILAAGFTRRPDDQWPGARLGELNTSSGGYEEKFYTSSLTGWTGWYHKLGQALDSLHLLNDEHVPVDLFTIERFQDHFIWNLWTNGTEKHACYSRSTGTKSFSWFGVNVSIPVPVEDVLTSAYGPDFLTPAPWKWDVNPFTVGSCK